MAKFRSNHSRRTGSLGLIRFILFIPVAAVLLIYGYQWIERNLVSPDSGTEMTNLPDSLRFYIPVSQGTDQLIHHRFFSLGYSEAHEQPSWVAYTLTRDQLNMKKYPRPDNFRPDYAVRTRSAFHRDYTGSGYTRGHLVPAADMSFDSIALEETFYMSNISPQTRSFNNGVWRELEEGTRDWVWKFGKLYIVTGPILSNVLGTLGKNKVSVPQSFYKVILDLEDPEVKGIGFVIPNRLVNEPLSNFVHSIDRVEEITQIDFFPELMHGQLEERVEQTVDIELWPINLSRYAKRINEWNYR